MYCKYLYVNTYSTANIFQAESDLNTFLFLWLIHVITRIVQGFLNLNAGCWPGTASEEARLGHRIAKCIVAGRVRGLGGGCFKLDRSGLTCATDRLEGGSFRASHLGAHRCWQGLGVGW